MEKLPSVVQFTPAIVIVILLTCRGAMGSLTITASIEPPGLSNTGSINPGGNLVLECSSSITGKSVEWTYLDQAAAAPVPVPVNASSLPDVKISPNQLVFQHISGKQGGTYICSDGVDTKEHVVEVLNVMKEEIPLSVAFGFTVPILVLAIILALLYHRRIAKAKRRHEEMSKMHTNATLRRNGGDLPDHVYTEILEQPGVSIIRPENRRPLQTIYTGHQPPLPSRAPRFPPNGQAPPVPGRKVSFVLPTSTVIPMDASQASSGDSTARPLSKERNTPMKFLRSIMNKTRGKEPVSEGYLARKNTIRGRDRSSSFPFLYDDGTDGGDLKPGKAPSGYFPVVQPDYLSAADMASYKTAGSHVTPHQSVSHGGDKHEKFYTPSPESIASVPVTINLEDCGGDDGCKFVKTIK